MSEFTMTDSQKCTVTATVVDKKGAPAAVDGVPAWTSSNPSVIDVQPAADGMSAVLVAGVPGEATIGFSADADLGSGITEIGGTLTGTITSGAAVAATLAAGAPEEQ